MMPDITPELIRLIGIAGLNANDVCSITIRSEGRIEVEYKLKDVRGEAYVTTDPETGEKILATDIKVVPVKWNRKRLR